MVLLRCSNSHLNLALQAHSKAIEWISIFKWIILSNCPNNFWHFPKTMATIYQISEDSLYRGIASTIKLLLEAKVCTKVWIQTTSSLENTCLYSFSPWLFIYIQVQQRLKIKHSIRTFPSTCKPFKCNFVRIPKPNLFVSFTASIALISSAVWKFIPNSKTWI